MTSFRYRHCRKVRDSRGHASILRWNLGRKIFISFWFMAFVASSRSVALRSAVSTGPHFLGLGMTRTFGVARTFGVFLGLGLTRTFGVFKPQTQIAFPYVQTVSNVHLAVYPKPENKKLNELLTSKPAYPERHRGRPIAHRVRSRTEARGTGGTETGGTEPCSPPRAK